MIPLRDVNPHTRTPYINYCIVSASVIVFFYELMLGPRLRYFVFTYGLVPVRYSEPQIARHFTLLEQLMPFFSSMFIHGGWLHLIGNMWILYIFGDNVESVLGHVRYLCFYILCGFVAAFIHLVTNFGSQLPTIGASGAIAGVMGAYFVLFPHARILTLVPIFFFLTLVEIPAYVFLAFWFVIQFFNGTFSLLGAQASFGGVAWWAHIGGFLGGIFLLRVFLPARRF